MIDIIQWRSTIGSFNWKFKCYIGHKYTNNAFENGMLHTTVNNWFDIGVLYVNILHIVLSDWLDVAVLHVKGMFPTALNDWFDIAVLHMGHSIPNQHKIDMTSSNFYIISHT